MFTVAAVMGLLAMAAPSATRASELAGRIVFAGGAVPGATVTATQGDHVLRSVSDESGAFRFVGIDAGEWTLRVEMVGFATVTVGVTVPHTGPPLEVTLTMRPYAEIVAGAPTSTLSFVVTPTPVQPGTSDPSGPPDPSGTEASVLNGSVINGAASVFAQPRAFGNARPGGTPLYTGGVNVVLGNSAWNARPYSFGGSAVPTPSYGDVQIGGTLGGPLRIPWLLTNGPQMVLSYQHSLLHTATSQSALMPTEAERAGDFSGLASPVRDPLTGLPFAGNIIPADRISPQAGALLAYYPLPTGVDGIGGANFQAPVVSASSSDSVQLLLSQNLSNRTTLAGTFTLQRAVTNSVSLFDFADSNRQTTVNAGVNWTRRFNTRLQVRLRYQFGHTGTTVTPFFAGRTNVSGDAGIVGNSQDAADWGPPTLAFPDIADLQDVEYQRAVTQSHGAGAEISLKRGRHNLTFGGDARRMFLDQSSQPNPRGTLSFTGVATGSAFGDFLLGLPTTSALAFGGGAARLRGNTYDAYFTDDLRLGAGLTVNLGARWEYESPFTEASGRLVNLDVAPDFAAVSPVVGTDPVGALTGVSYPTSLVRPDKRGLEPRVAASWRPVLGSSLIVRGSYGLYRNLGIYQPLALLLAQQPPFSTSINVQASPLVPLSLANPFPASLPNTNTFAVDPNYRTGYAHQWQVSLQRDFPASLTALVSYDGSKGSHLMQASLPNTYPAGALNPCSTCPSGFVYISSNGSSLRNAAQFTLRRRLQGGFTATIQYTLSKSTDDAATFNNRMIAPASLSVAQDWLNLEGERGPSSFDQRHLVSAQVQYTTGQGLTGGTLVDGLWGALFKDWTFAGQLTRGSGLPFTPVSFVAVSGTGIVGMRPSLTGVSTDPANGTYANPAAYETPAPGSWGDAGRNSLRGPAQFSLDMSVARVFRLNRRLNLEWRIAATNVLNRVTFASVGTVITSPQFGLPTLANPMRRLQMTLRLRF